MRASVSVLAALSFLSVPASAEDIALETSLNNPAYSHPAKAWKTLEDAKHEVVLNQAEGVQIASPEDRSCRDRITYARQRLGQPPLLERQPASPDKPHLIYAVDRREDGCSVMVMKGDPDDIRPLPLPSDRPFLMIPAEGAEEIEKDQE